MKRKFKAFLLIITVLCTVLTGCGQKETTQIHESVTRETYQAILPIEVESSSIYVQAIDGLSQDFIKGMDVSSILSEEAAGVKYYNEAGKEEDVFKILADSGINYARIRVWNDPYDSKGNGYGGGNNDVAAAVKLGARAADYGMKSCIDFHYSDFWADPSKQMAPKAWAHLTFADKVSAIYDFTYESLAQIIDGGAEVGMVQIGNEINHGLAGVTDFSKELELLVSASNAVRKIAADKNTNIKIVVHFTEIDNPTNILKIAGQLIDAGVDYDVFGISYYTYWHGTMENMTKLLADISQQYGKETCVMETAYTYTGVDADGSANSISGDEPMEGYPASVQGQANLLRDVMYAANKGGAIGVFYWEGCWIAASNNYSANKELYESTGAGWASSYAGKYDKNDAGKYYGGCSWDNQTLFDANGCALPSLSVFKYVNYGAVGKELEILALPDLKLEIQKGTEVKMPEAIAAYYNDSSVTDPVSVLWNQQQLEAIDVNTAGIYEVEGETPEGHAVKASVKITSINYLQNASFEESDISMWQVTSTTGEDPTDIQNKASDAHNGNKAFHWWSNASQDFQVFQTLSQLPEGIYFADAFLQGGDMGSNANVYLFVNISHADGTTESLTAQTELTGWINWKNPELRGIEIKEGDTVDVGVNITCAAKGWGTLDDIEFAME